MNLRAIHILAFCCLLFTGGLHQASAQDVRAGLDSLKVKKDSLRIVRMDTSKTGDSLTVYASKNSADTSVAYVSKDSVVYDLKEKKMRLYTGVTLDYGETHLTSEKVTLDWNNSTLHAEGKPDTAAARQGKMTGTPVFRQGKEEYLGNEMTYNFRSKKGTILYGETKVDNGFYLGENIHRMSDDVYFIRNGQYTTCDAPDHKHYYFGSPKMKFIPSDVVIAEPVYLYIEDVPIFALPFAVIPTRGGRASGIIPPTYGEVNGRGKYLAGGGYYWAMNDYVGAKFTADWYTKGGYQLNTAWDYNLRYHFNGSISASYGRRQDNIGLVYLPDDQPRTEYRVNILHSQQIDPTANLNANFSFQSSSYYQRFSTNLNDLLQQNVRSNASFSKSWEGNRSLTLNVSRDQNLTNGTSTNILPSVSFNQSSIYPFRGKNVSAEPAWYEQIGLNYSGQFQQNLFSQVEQVDTVSVTQHYERRGARHDITLLATPKAGYITISPTFRYSEVWYDHRTERYQDMTDSLVKAKDINRFSAIRTYDMGVQLSTNLYGTIQPNLFGIMGLRHKLTPSISYNFRPDFSKTYYESYQDTIGRQVRYDPYSGLGTKPGEIYGGVSAGESQSIGFGLANNFEMKLNPAAADTTNTPRKVQLLTLNLSSSYNVAADSFRLAPIGMSFNTNVGELLSLGGNASFSPYLFENGRQRDRYMVNEGKGLARLTSFGINFSTSIGSETFTPAPSPADTASKGLALAQASQGYKFTIPWRLTLNYSYSMEQSNPAFKSRSSNLYANVSFTLGDVWRIGMSGYYDFVNATLGAPNITVGRDLHCWEMTFSWTPTGPWTQYAFMLRIKAPQLQDIKLEKKGSSRGIY